MSLRYKVTVYAVQEDTKFDLAEDEQILRTEWDPPWVRLVLLVPVHNDGPVSDG